MKHAPLRYDPRGPAPDIEESNHQIKFINIRQQVIKSTHIKKKQNEEEEFILQTCIQNFQYKIT